MIKRINKIGVTYILSTQEDSSTKIQLMTGKSIVVRHPLDMLNQAWFNWSNKNKLIQDAFYFLTPGEREFLITGITDSEWNKMFKDVK